MINKEVNVHGELQKQRQQLEPNRNPTELRPTLESLLRAVHSVWRCAGLCCWQPLQACGGSGNAEAAQPENQAKARRGRRTEG